MSASRLRAVDMAVLNLFSCANRITIVDGAERSPGNTREFGIGQCRALWKSTWTDNECWISFHKLQLSRKECVVVVNFVHANDFHVLSPGSV